MDVEKGGHRTIVFVVFDHGRDITQSILDRLLPKCADWNALSPVGRAGTVATLALFSSSKLKGAPAELNKNRAAVAVCLAERASLAESTGAAECTTDKAFEDKLQQTVLSVASECLMSQRSAAAE